MAPAGAEAQLLSPGTLSRAHAELDGDTHCSECHSSGRQVDNARCSRCHGDVARQVRASRGLHGREYRNRDCGGCHVEHRGRGAQQIRWPNGSVERFDHDLSGWPLRSGHASVECRDCHDQRNSRGARTFLGLRRACSSCHEDPHDARFGTDCADCHNESDWSRVRMDGFDHSHARFPLRGRHQRVECGRCHGQPPRWRGIEFANCSSCHSDPHAGRFGANCVNCHSESGWSELTGLRANHPGVSLGGGHGRVACERCHDRGVDAAPSRGPRCVNCHRPVHEANLGANCARCHGQIRWTNLPRRVGLRTHAHTPFPLRGEHEDVECSGCHRTDLPRAERYRGLTFEACKSCHEDRHDGEFASRGGGACEGCHTERGFAPSLFGAELHASTSLALEGRHEIVPCGACHEGERPRLDWRITEGQRCERCHENPHGDQFASEMRQGGCASCHGPAGWDQPNIDHSTWPLTGAHQLIACDSCHSPTDADRRTGRGASYRGASRECEGCHADIHAGQFRLSDPARECTACHTTVQFEIPDFDHAGKADYPLANKHAEAECAACHPTASLRNGARVVRYRLDYRECSDCHANPHAEGDR